jgi:hypothetical protein
MINKLWNRRSNRKYEIFQDNNVIQILPRDWMDSKSLPVYYEAMFDRLMYKTVRECDERVFSEEYLKNKSYVVGKMINMRKTQRSLVKFKRLTYYT